MREDVSFTYFVSLSHISDTGTSVASALFVPIVNHRPLVVYSITFPQSQEVLPEYA